MTISLTDKHRHTDRPYKTPYPLTLLIYAINNYIYLVESIRNVKYLVGASGMVLEYNAFTASICAPSMRASFASTFVCALDANIDAAGNGRPYWSKPEPYGGILITCSFPSAVYLMGGLTMTVSEGGEIGWAAVKITGGFIITVSAGGGTMTGWGTAGSILSHGSPWVILLHGSLGLTLLHGSVTNALGSVAAGLGSSGVGRSGGFLPLKCQGGIDDVSESSNRSMESRVGCSFLGGSLKEIFFGGSFLSGEWARLP